ncbi:MAG: glycosyltransferase family A protein [Patescibacteria group bacterium]
MVKPKNKPLVSVLVCSYNAEQFILPTLRSVLDQTYREMEVLIWDNASHDLTTQLINELSQKDKRLQLYKSEKNIGPYAGLNRLLEKAKGEYIAINDHDDIWHSAKLEKQIAYLEQNPGYTGCGSAIINWYEKYNTTFYRSQPVRSDIAWHTSLVFRNGGYRYDASVPVGTDFYFMKNILSKNKKVIYNSQEPMVMRRIFKDSSNLSGKWMKKAPVSSIFKLKIGLFDRLALLNRRLFSQNWVEWMVVQFYKNNIPKKYENYKIELDQINTTCSISKV